MYYVICKMKQKAKETPNNDSWSSTRKIPSKPHLWYMKKRKSENKKQLKRYDAEISNLSALQMHSMP